MLTGTALLLVVFGAVVFIVLAASVWKIHPFLALLLAALLTGLIVGVPTSKIAEAVNQGFGNLMTHIGVVVVLGCMIGVLLEKTGATWQIAKAILAVFGKKRPVLGITVIGAVVGIPIFCDSGYVILSGLTRPLARESGKPFAGISLGLAGGLYTTHTLLPPHPGPLAAAGNFGLSGQLGTVILVGLLLSVPVTLVVFAAAARLGQRIRIVLPDENASAEAEKYLPPTWQSFLPIFVPIGLLALASFANADLLALPGSLKKTVHFLGSPVVALLLGLGLAFALIRRPDRPQFPAWLREAAEQAGIILILVGAGGAFGNLLKQTPITDMVSDWVTQSRPAGGWFLLVAFGIGCLLKTAQGSTTSAMIIGSSVLGPLLGAVGFDTPVELSLLLAALGGGAMTVSHANDAYFWVISQFSGFTLRDGYRGITPLTLVQGISVLVTVLAVYAVMM
ncbi:MAG: GntP family permease [Cytophagales bacterium]|nr:GntP family permease [Cytophagales bacterium]